MAAPFILEDLAKLKSFVEFVAANPAILNMPQLDFLKKLIEQLGGKVPQGAFQMPAGAKCPFGGDVKSESKSTPPPASAEEDDGEYEYEAEQEEIPEMEVEESEESEVELDMEANNMTVLEPNILYLDEKPPKILRTKKSRKIKKSTKMVAAKSFGTKKSLVRKSSGKLKRNHAIIFSADQLEKNKDFNDPLYTEKLDIKCELKEYKDKINIKSDENSYELVMMESKLESSEVDFDGNDEYEDDEAEDEPLIRLIRRKGRPRKNVQPESDDESIKIPRNVVCREICKQHCTEKFSEKQRKNICDYFWNLEKEERLCFIRKHTRTRRLTRMKRVNAIRSRGNNCCYYLKNYSIGENESIPDLGSELIRVCRKFFEATLCTTNHYIKKANDGSIQEIEKDLLLLHEIKLAKEKVQEKVKESKQILDPVTGDLITFDVKTKQYKDTNKKQRVRRKPGDPEPEHFPKPIKCFQTCIHKCHIKFNEEERKKICDFFWSMDYKRRKDFILANMEVKDIETETTPDFRKTNRPPRAYQSRFYMRSGGTRGEKVRVCKDFFSKTLLVNRYFIKNAIEFADKTTGYYTGTDRRGIHGAPNKISDDRKQTVMQHIESYPYWIPNKKSKTKYLHHSLTIKKMYEAYKEKCLAEKKLDLVSLHYYYKVFHAHFHVLFLANPQPKKGGGFLKSNPNISHYTGEEAGGYWIDSKGNKLDLRSIDLALSLDVRQQNLLSPEARNSSFSCGSETRTLNISRNPTAGLTFKTLLNQQSSHSLIRSDLNATTLGNGLRKL